MWPSVLAHSCYAVAVRARSRTLFAVAQNVHDGDAYGGYAGT
jgi:hypothetical protein